MPKKKAKKSRVSSAKKPISKAAFVRSLPAATSAKDVIAKAKSVGIALTQAYVYNVRATSRAGAQLGKGRTQRRAGVRHRNGKGHKVRTSRGAEDRLRDVAAELGLARAIAVLQAEHARVRKLLGN